MCGIAGIVGLHGLEAPETCAKQMTDALAHRGPDAEGIWRGPDVVFGHRRLSIIDLSSAGTQPFHSADGRYAMVYNGEVYNYLHLRSEIERLENVPFRTSTDTEVVLRAYMHWGEACLDKLEGMFALAIHDAENGAVFLARDRFGIKPLYYHVNAERLLFASELRALLATGLVPRQLDTEHLADYLRYSTVHAPCTLVKNVHMLRPGHFLRWKEHTLKERAWWNMAERASTDVAALPKATVLKEVRERLTKAVEKRLIADVPFGAFLSGGIDSSAVVGLMAEVSAAPIHTFCVTFNEAKFSEARFAAVVAKKFGTTHTNIRLQPNDMLRHLPSALEAMDHPSGDGPNTWVVSKMTKEAGITMALSGLGGDEVFAGYDVFKRSLALQRRNWLMTVPRPLRLLAATALRAARPSAAMMKAAAVIAGTSLQLKDTYPVSRLAFMDDEVHRLLNGGMLPANAVEKEFDSLLNDHAGHRLPLLSQVSLAELSTYVPDVLLRDADQMSMAHALEVRVPFLDHHLVEFVLGVSDEKKYPRTPKALLVESLGDLLPPEIVNRPKMGFTLPWEQWMKGALRSFCEGRLMALKKCNAFDHVAVMLLWKRFLKEDKRITWSRVWFLVVLSDWMERNGIEG